MSKIIKTLDGKSWNEEDLLFRMEEDKFYYDYLGKNALSSSAVTKLLTSPKSYEDSLNGIHKPTPEQEFGWLFHASILEPDVYSNQIFVDVKTKNAKAYKDAVETHGRVFTTGDARKVERLSDSFFTNSLALRMIKKARTEVPAIGELFGLPFRAKADILGDGYVVDLKTTSNANKFKSSCYIWNYDAQCYIYCNLFNIEPENFFFVAVDKNNGTLAINDSGCSIEFYNSGMEKVEEAVEKYKDYIQNKEKEIGDYYIPLYL